MLRIEAVRCVFVFALSLLMLCAGTVSNAWAESPLQQTADIDANASSVSKDPSGDANSNLVDVKFFIALYPDAEEYPVSLSDLETLIRSRYTSAMEVDNALNISDIPPSSSDVKIDSVANKGASIEPLLVHRPSEEAIAQACANQGIDYSSEAYAIVWYVAKLKGDGWHIDGLLIPKHIVVPDPEPQPDPEPEPTPDPQPNPEPDPEPAPDPNPIPNQEPQLTGSALGSLTMTAPNASAASTRNTAATDYAARIADLPDNDTAAMVIAPTPTQPYAGTSYTLSAAEEALGLSDTAAMTIRAVGIAGALIAVIGLGLTGAGTTGAISGLSSMDASLRSRGRKQ